MNKRPRYFFVISTLAVGLLAVSIASAQFDYYDPYSNSNIDYFPMNPIYTSPSTSDGGSTGSDSTGSTGTSDNTSSSTTKCNNRPFETPLPAGTRSVEIKDMDGNVYYTVDNGTAIDGVRAFPETSTTIYRITYGTNGKEIDEREVGRITTSLGCYPKYGYIDTILDPATGSNALPSVAENESGEGDMTIPPDATAVTLDAATGKVYNAKTGVLINDARYDVSARAIYYKDTNSTFGKVLTDTYGYVNIDLRGAEGVVPGPGFKDTKNEDVSALVDLMTQQKTYTMPKNKKFGAKKKLKGKFAVQILAAVSQLGCGSDTKYPGYTKCKKYLVENGILAKKFASGKQIMRGDFYALLLEARGIPLKEAYAEDATAFCTDALNPSVYAAQVLRTAFDYGIAKTYEGGKCLPLKPITQEEAAELAIRAMGVEVQY